MLQQQQCHFTNREKDLRKKETDEKVNNTCTALFFDNNKLMHKTSYSGLLESNQLLPYSTAASIGFPDTGFAATKFFYRIVFLQI
jgi:hypothetical protein